MWGQWCFVLACVWPSGAQWSWEMRANMSAARAQFVGAVLPSGKLLVAGGPGRTAELYDPATQAWAFTGNMSVARSNRFEITRLTNGSLLVTGGSATNTEAELYDSATGTWTSAGDMTIARQEHTSTLLQDGRVLVTGGSGTASCNIFDPQTSTWSPVQALPSPHRGHSATLLASGKVLVVGENATIYDPQNDTWTEVGGVPNRRNSHTATLLQDGRVLIVGGQLGVATDGTTSTQVFQPSNNTWVSSSLSKARFGHVAFLLSSEEVVVTGGFGNGVYLNSTEIYNPATNTWTTIASLNIARINSVGLAVGSNLCVIGGFVTGAIGVKTMECLIPVNTSAPTSAPTMTSAGNSRSMNAVYLVLGVALFEHVVG